MPGRATGQDVAGAGVQTPNGAEAAEAALDWLAGELSWQARLHLLERTAVGGSIRHVS